MNTSPKRKRKTAVVIPKASAEEASESLTIDDISVGDVITVTFAEDGTAATIKIQSADNGMMPGGQGGPNGQGAPDGQGMPGGAPGGTTG